MLNSSHTSNLFVITLEYLAPISIVEQHLPAHREFLNLGYRDGIFILSGRKVPRTGGVIIAIADSKESLCKLLENDPFKIHKVAEYIITEFEPTQCNEALLGLIGNS